MGNSSSRTISAGDDEKTVLMPVATTMLDVFPDEMVLKIGETLSLKDKARLTSMSKYYHRLFQPELRAARLLLFVVRGEQDAADAMLRQHPELILKCGDVTDYSGRTFKKITAYEYAYWAKDTHMCRMLEAHMDDATKAKMFEGIDAMERDGLTYEQHGVVEHSKHFDFTPLITALTRYVQGFNHWHVTSNQAARITAWMEVGLAQRDIPAHLAQEYCRRDRSFSPLPLFNVKEESLPRTLAFYNYDTTDNETWYPLAVSPTSGLGFDFALLRAHIDEARAGLEDATDAPRWPWGVLAAFDLAAVSHLDEVRTADLTLSRENLQPRGPEHMLS